MWFLGSSEEVGREQGGTQVAGFMGQKVGKICRASVVVVLAIGFVCGKMC